MDLQIAEDSIFFGCYYHFYHVCFYHIHIFELVPSWCYIKGHAWAMVLSPRDVTLLIYNAETILWFFSKDDALAYVTFCLTKIVTYFLEVCLFLFLFNLCTQGGLKLTTPRARVTCSSWLSVRHPNSYLFSFSLPSYILTIQYNIIIY